MEVPMGDWFSDLGNEVWQNGASALSGAASGGLAGFAAGGPVGAAIGALGGGVAGWSASDAAAAKIQNERDYNAQLMQREDNAVQRRAQDMQKAGFNPMLAAGSPAQASAGIPVGSYDKVAAGFRGSTDLLTMANLVQDSLLKGVQVGKGTVDIQGGQLANQLSKDTLDWKKMLPRYEALGAGIDYASKLAPADAQKLGLQDSPYVQARRDALIAEAKRQGFDTTSRAATAALDELSLKWAKEADSLGVGYARGVGDWTGAVGKAVPGASFLIGRGGQNIRNGS